MPEVVAVVSQNLPQRDSKFSVKFNRIAFPRNLKTTETALLYPVFGMSESMYPF